MTETLLTGGGRTPVSRAGDVVYRAAGPWSKTVHAFLRHLEVEGYAAAPRVIGSGFDEQGRETLSYVEGDVTLPHTWGAGAMPRLGGMLRDLHEASSTFRPPAEATWRPWHGRRLGDAKAGFGHGDAAPWNVITRAGVPCAFIDWEVAGPVDPLYDLAQACWTNAQLYDDEVAERVGLPALDVRARHAREILDGYELARRDRVGFVDRMIEFAVHDGAAQVEDVGIQPKPTDGDHAWAVTWRVRSAGWMLRHRPALEAAIL